MLKGLREKKPHFKPTALFIGDLKFMTERPNLRATISYTFAIHVFFDALHNENKRTFRSKYS